ncbi:Hypothetical predicted protein [Cloeon dipterum]|uniref:Uncharacterized protein n=1 Tax=Cloeon dipterum TaxID=197152 RepID=A0A8S1E0V5_9INSE|nr:Hypothetical predicted protein [Cloeon dipterum]
MSLQKTLCLICEHPTADGAISAVHVDKEKLQEWFLNVCGHELAEEIEDEDKICYFCLWHAEFLWKFNQMADEVLVWSPGIRIIWTMRQRSCGITTLKGNWSNAGCRWRKLSCRKVMMKKDESSKLLFGRGDGNASIAGKDLNILELFLNI